MKKRRTFDHEFKQMVIELSNNREDYTALAAELDIRADLIYRWRREANKHLKASFPGHGNKIQTEDHVKDARVFLLIQLVSPSYYRDGTSISLHRCESQ